MPVEWLITTPTFPSGVTPAQLGITLGRRTLRNRAASEVTLSCALPNIYADAPVQYGDWVTIIRNGVVWFAGQVSSDPEVSISEGNLSVGIVVSDPWYWWQQITYLQQWPSGPSTRTMMGGAAAEDGSMGYTDGDPITTATQIAALLAYAQSCAVLSPSRGLFTPAGLALTSTPMFCEPLSSAPVSSALDTCLRYHPNLLTWFDYTHRSGGKPSPALYMADYGANSGWDSVAIPFGEITRPFKIRSRPDLVLAGVVFYYELGAEGLEEDGETPLGYGASEWVYTDSAGSSGGLINPASTLISTMQVGNGVTWGVIGAYDAYYSTAPVPIGLADVIYLNHQKLHYDGSITLMPGRVQAAPRAASQHHGLSPGVRHDGRADPDGDRGHAHRID